MIKFVFKSLLTTCLIPLSLVVFTPLLFPVYFLLVFFLIVYKFLRKSYDYFLGEPIKLADELSNVQDLVLTDDPRPNRMPDTLVPYGKGCLIETYHTEGIYRVFNERLKGFGKNFASLKEAKEEIDKFEPLAV